MPPKIGPAAARQLKAMAKVEREKPFTLDGMTVEETAQVEASFRARHEDFVIDTVRQHLNAQQESLLALAAKAPGGGLKLEDIIDFLRSDAGKHARAALEKQLGPDDKTAAFTNLLQLPDEPERSPWTTAPRDGFEAKTRDVLLNTGELPFSLGDSGMVKAVTHAFAEVTGSNGRIDEAALRKRGPKTGAKLYDYIAEVTHGEPVPNSVPGTKLDQLGLDAVIAAGSGVDLKPILERMPAFHQIATQLLGGKQPFENVRVVAIQHLLPSFAADLWALEEGGARRYEMRLLGKSYSTIDEMYAWLVSEGYPVDPKSLAGSARSVEEHLVEAARETLAELFDGVDPKTSKERFVIADDGGKLLYTLHKYFPEYAHLCTGFEQTARGIQVLEQMQKEGIPLRCPVVNMAKCELKAETEIPLIGEQVVFDSLGYLDQMKLEHPKTATVLGYGPVGQATCAALRRRGIEVAAYDPNPSPEAIALAAKQGVKLLSREEAIGFGDMVIGASGQGAMTLDDYPLLKDGAVLVNGASGNHEMGTHAFSGPGRWFLEQAYEADGFQLLDGRVSANFRGHRVDLGSGDLGSAGQHRVVKDNETGKEALVLRSGHVVNFSRGLPPEWVQVTRALVFASMLQSLSETKAGIVDLSAKTQSLIRSTVMADFEQQGLSLLEPDFRKVADWSL